MNKFFANFWFRFRNDEAYFIGCIRSLIMTVALNGIVFGHDLAEALGAPAVERYIKVASIVCGGVSLFLKAGDKTPESVKRLAAESSGAPSA
jgi:hypothetical protein